MRMKTDVYDRTKDTQELVFPGTQLAVTEEFLGGSGTYSTDRFIFASVIGNVVIDVEKHEISVVPKPKSAVIPKNGDIFVGSVVNASRQMVTVAIYFINNSEINPTFTLVIHVSQVSKEYLETVDEGIRFGDIIRGKIIDAKTIPLQGSLIGSQLGVVLASCSICGGKLDKIGRDRLKCVQCNQTERRKTTIDYGTSHLQFKL